MRIRRFEAGDETALFEVYYSAIHLVARQHYSEEQVNAWAPCDLDPELWAKRVQGIDPFVAVLGGNVVGYADVQASGYIDHFFVSGRHPRMGIGRALMETLHEEAARLDVSELTSDVSVTAQPFFQAFGFEIVERRMPTIRGVALPNAFMRKSL